MTLLPAGVAREGDAVAFPGGALTRAELEGAAAALRARLPAEGAVALWAQPSLVTTVGLVAALRAGLRVVPIDPRCGAAELARIVEVSGAGALIAEGGVRAAGLETLTPDLSACGEGAEDRSHESALIVFTSGTTGPSKGVVLPARAIAANLDALARAWEWSGRDVLVHALPLFHVHGLVVATIGSLRLGAAVRHLGSFDPAAVAAALGGEATMLFAVPTMYHRLADAAAADSALARGLRGARLLVSGSAALAAAEHARIEALCGQRIVERYGMTETLMIASVRAGGERRAGYVGLALEGVELCVLDDDGAAVPADDATIGEVHVRGASLFEGYLNAPEETARAFREGWFRTGDLAVLAPDGYLRLVGRRSTDLIKSGGYRIGAGEIESALLEHPAVAEAAVLGVADADLGERIVAWVVARAGASVEERELIDHVASTLTPHKRPREVRFVPSLPRNALGKVQKRLLAAG